MICRRGKFLNWKVKRVNFLLKHIFEENEYFLIDNSNIEIRGLWKNVIHLTELDKIKLSQNFIYSYYFIYSYTILIEYLFNIIFMKPTHQSQIKAF